jgi:hypothetical protein
MGRARSTNVRKRSSMSEWEEKRPLGKLRRRWEVNNKMDLREIT